MNFKSIGKIVKNSAKYAGAFISKNSPTILTIIGATGIVTAAVIACKSTVKKNDILEPINDEIVNEKELYESDNEHSEEEAKLYRKTIFDLYLKKGKEIVKLYAPSVIIGVASIGCFCASNHILNKRYSACIAACTTTERLFSDYRKRVVEDLGKEADKKYRYGIKTVEEEVPVLDKKGNPKLDKDGNPKTEKKTTKYVDRNKIDYDFSALFDEITTKQWDPNYEYNLYYLRNMQQHANELLKSRGYLFLNEIKQLLGLKIDEAGQDVGWIYIKDNPNGDNYVDFGLDEVVVINQITGYTSTPAEHMSPENNAVLLTFNCDGYIKDKIVMAQKIYD